MLAGDGKYFGQPHHPISNLPVNTVIPTFGTGQVGNKQLTILTILTIKQNGIRQQHQY